ncbi:TniB family NTP-binding protein [Shimia sp. R9_2]|uniref:TniB family NTP-binding protein n=1 Tax=Shimia sp. R9_2 TaxID=2821112 RepID=UPI001ADAA40D|nr:TniB family NTP-binding protein [Shimia sp. R9_2]MBO9398108.1 TniB family NTP-binding protein [Shimia sp. R9_2]
MTNDSRPQPEAVDIQIARLRDLFVAHHASDELRLSFDRRLRERRAATQLGSRIKARGLALVGASGSGKTTAMDRLFDTHPDLILAEEGRETAEVLRLQVPSPASLKNVGTELLHGLGYPLSRDKSAAIIWTQVRQFLRARKTLFLHLDEAQDLYVSKGVKARNDVVNTLKSLMNDRDWPVGLVLSGTHDLLEMINSDAQLRRRLHVIHLNPVSWASHGADVSQILAGLIAKAGLRPTEQVQLDEFLKRLIHAGGNEFGLIIEMSLGGIEEALYSKDLQLTVEHFAASFRRKTGCIPAFNPFLAEDFQRIDVRKIIGWDASLDPSLPEGHQ